MTPSSVATAASTTSPSRRYFGFLACRLKNAFHFIAGGNSEPMISIGLGGADSAVPTGVPVKTRSPGSSRWNRAKSLQRLHRRIDHVAVDFRVLADFAIDS